MSPCVEADPFRQLTHVPHSSLLTTVQFLVMEGWIAGVIPTAHPGSPPVHRQLRQRVTEERGARP